MELLDLNFSFEFPGGERKEEKPQLFFFAHLFFFPKPKPKPINQLTHTARASSSTTGASTSTWDITPPRSAKKGTSARTLKERRSISSTRCSSGLGPQQRAPAREEDFGCRVRDRGHVEAAGQGVPGGAGGRDHALDRAGKEGEEEKSFFFRSFFFLYFLTFFSFSTFSLFLSFFRTLPPTILLSSGHARHPAGPRPGPRKRHLPRHGRPGAGV